MSDFGEETVMNDDSFGGGSVCIDTSGNFSHLPPRERKKAKERQRAQHERLRKAEAVRATWTPEQFAEEARQIAAQVAEWERQRDAT